MKKEIMPLTGEPIWKDLQLDFNLISEFIKENYKENFTLSIYDEITCKTMEINCKPEEILEIIGTVSNVEHSLIDWIGINSLSKSYVVGMNLTRGVFTPGIYTFIENHIQRVTLV